MTLDEAKVLLDTLFRDELYDNEFGDTEVYWTTNNDDEIASGYFGLTGDEVHIIGAKGFTDALFTNADARALRACGFLQTRTRNDGG